jgi:hypothetical protein
MANATIAGMLADSGASIGSTIGGGIAGLGKAAGGMLQSRADAKNKAEQQSAIEKELQQYANDPAQLNAMGQKYQSQGRTDVANAFYAAAKQATAKRTAQVSALDTGGQDIQKEAQRKRAVQVARQKGDQEALTALNARAMDPAEYLKGLATAKPKSEGFTLSPGSIRYDAQGNELARAPFKPEEPKKPTVSIKESNGEFVVFEDGVEVRRYDTAEKAGLAAAELRKTQNAVRKAQNAQISIADAIEMIDTNQDVGGWKSLLRYLPASDARRFEGLLTSVKANVGFDQLLSIKEAGSTLGQVSNIENLLLQSTIDSLDSLTSKKDLKVALNRIDAYYTSLVTKAQYGEDAPLKDWAGSVNWTQPEFARMYEQSGGEIVVNEQEGTVLVKSPSGEMVKLLVDR